MVSVSKKMYLLQLLIPKLEKHTVKHFLLSLVLAGLGAKASLT